MRKTCAGEINLVNCTLIRCGSLAKLKKHFGWGVWCNHFRICSGHTRTQLLKKHETWTEHRMQPNTRRHLPAINFNLHNCEMCWSLQMICYAFRQLPVMIDWPQNNRTKSLLHFRLPIHMACFTVHEHIIAWHAWLPQTFDRFIIRSKPETARNQSSIVSAHEKSKIDWIVCSRDAKQIIALGRVVDVIGSSSPLPSPIVADLNQMRFSIFN